MILNHAPYLNSGMRKGDETSLPSLFMTTHTELMLKQCMSFLCTAFFICFFMFHIMLHFKPLGWQNEYEASPTIIHLKHHRGADQFFWYLALQFYYWNKLSSVMMHL